MKKSNVKSLIAAILFIAFIATAVTLQTRFSEPGPIHFLAGVSGVIFLFSLLVRKNVWFEPYFTSNFNLFTSKVKHQQELDFPKDLLFDKLVEVLQTSGFNIVQTDKNAGKIFATSTLSFSSWGENIYIDLSENNNKTILNFCSACLFQVVSWGKNERNYQTLFEEFEKSLII